MHLALEGNGLSFDDRLRYLGHLAMCARLFKAVMLDEPVEFMEECISIENRSFGYATPRDERGVIAKESWSVLSPVLEQYIALLRDA
jgi:hypothetical protein